MDRQQARDVAAGVAGTIRDAFPGLAPLPSSSGTGLAHALHLAERLSRDGVGCPPGEDRTGSALSAAYRSRHPGLEPDRLPGGIGPAHALFMAWEIASGMSANKSLRWLGYLQVMGAYEGLAPVPDDGPGDPESEEAAMLALGRIQGIMVHEGATSLASEKDRSRVAVGG